MKNQVALIMWGLLLLPQLLTGQAVKWGRSHQKPDKNLHISQVIGKTPQGIFTLLTDMRKPAILPPILQCFGAELKLEKQVPLRLQYDIGSLTLETAVLLNDRLHLMLSFRDAAAGKMRLYAQEINPQNLQPYRAPRQIYEINFEEGLFANPLGYKISADHSKILIYNRFPYASGNWLRNWLVVCDENATPLWAIEPKFPWEEQSMQLLDYEVDNSGVAFVLLTHQHQTSNDKPAHANFSILAYHNNGSTLKTFPFNLDHQTPQQLELQLATDGSLICGGFFGNRLNDITGSFVVAIDQSSGSIQMHQQQFSPEEMAGLDGGSKRLPDFQLRALHLDPNGGITLVAEQFLPPFRGNGQRFYGQVLMVSYPRDLKSRKLNGLSKTQVSYDQGYFDSFAYLGKDDELMLVYNDKSNAPMRKARFGVKGTQLSALEYAGAGKLKVRPANCAALSEQELWIYAETPDKKNYMVGVMQL